MFDDISNCFCHNQRHLTINLLVNLLSKTLRQEEDSHVCRDILIVKHLML